MRLLSSLLKFVYSTTLKYSYDESHSLGHSMKVLQQTNHILNAECITNSDLWYQERVIYTSAILHDMCDRKYIDVDKGIQEIESFLNEKMPQYEIDAVKDIISTMSYSVVKKHGFPKLGNYQDAYHIVREADLLSAYDFDRSIIYHMHKTDGDYKVSYDNAKELFDNRILKYISDGLFVTKYSKQESKYLHYNAEDQIKQWEQIIISM